MVGRMSVADKLSVSTPVMADIFNYAKEMHDNEWNDVIKAPFLYVAGIMIADLSLIYTANLA